MVLATFHVNGGPNECAFAPHKTLLEGGPQLSRRQAGRLAVASRRFGPADDDAGVGQAIATYFEILLAAASLCPPLTGLALLGLFSRLVPKAFQLAYGIVGLALLLLFCDWFRGTRAPGPDIPAITSGLFVQVGTPLLIGLSAVWLVRRLRARRAATDPPAAT